MNHSVEREPESASEKRFGFGKNWSRYLNLVDETRISEACRSITRPLGLQRLDGLRFLDIGSGSGLSSLAAHRLVTRYAEEASWTHSVSYTTALAAARVLASAWVPDADWRGVDPTMIVESVNTALALEPNVLEFVEKLTATQSIVLLGSGAASTTAREGALKLREAAGRFVATSGVEEFLHGILPSVSPASAVVAFTATELERRRAREALQAAARVGALTMLLDSSGVAAGDGEWSVPLPFPELAAMPQIVPVQLTAHWLAVSEGRNPDVMGLDDARYLEARQGFGI